MSFRVVMFRVMRATAITLIVLLLLAFGALQIKQHLIRERSKRLLADFHSIRLNQTSWAEAQVLMNRWGKLGHAHGPCSATDCAYDITVTAWPSVLPSERAAHWIYQAWNPMPLILQHLGMRFSILDLRILVEDGAVRRTRLSITTEAFDEERFSVLFVNANSHAFFDGSEEVLHAIGADEELGVHPDFIVAPEGFCTGCETISLVYTPHIAPDELARLTSFNLSCFTRLWACSHLSDLAPALMRENAKNRQDVPRNSVPCSTPVWALARDAKAIWLADALATAQVPDPSPVYKEKPSLVEEDQIRIVKILKAVPSVPPQSTFRFRPYSGTEYEARAVPEHLVQGHRYILMPYADRDWLKEGAEAWRCGVIDDTPANELAVQQGIAMNDHLRAPELTGVWPW